MTPSGVRSAARRTPRSSVTALVVDPQAAALDLPARLAGRGHELRIFGAEGGQHAEARVEQLGRDLDGRQAFGQRALLEGLARGLGGLLRGLAAVEEGGRFRREHLLRLVDLGAVERFEPGDLVQRAGS